MTQRMGIVLASLISGLVALYLHLWKLGLAGTLSCSVGGHGCEYVQGSQYGWFLGYDVALIGTVGYALVFVVSLLGISGKNEDAVWPNTLLQILIWPAILFTLRLKYYEFFVLKGFCPWCLVSAIAISTCAILVVFDRRRLKGLAAAERDTATA